MLSRCCPRTAGSSEARTRRRGRAAAPRRRRRGAGFLDQLVERELAVEVAATRVEHRLLGGAGQAGGERAAVLLDLGFERAALVPGGEREPYTRRDQQCDDERAEFDLKRSQKGCRLLRWRGSPRVGGGPHPSRSVACELYRRWYRRVYRRITSAAPASIESDVQDLEFAGSLGNLHPDRRRRRSVRAARARSAR